MSVLQRGLILSLISPQLEKCAGFGSLCWEKLLRVVRNYSLFKGLICNISIKSCHRRARVDIWCLIFIAVGQQRHLVFISRGSFYCISLRRPLRCRTMPMRMLAKNVKHKFMCNCFEVIQWSYNSYLILISLNIGFNAFIQKGTCRR